MVLKYVISPYPALHEPMVVRIWEAQNDGPLGWVFEQVLPELDINGNPAPGGGHNVPNVITAQPLDLLPHIVRLYTQSGALLHEYLAEPTADVVTVFDPIRFKIGDGGALTPAIGTDIYSNPLLGGLGPDDYIILRKFVGALYPGGDVTYLQDVNGHYTGEWRLAAPDQFGDQEEFTMILQPKVVSNIINDSVVGKWVSGFVDIVAVTNYIPAHLRKLIRLNGNVVFNFPALAAIPIGYGYAFNHFGANPANAIINFNNAPLRWGNGVKNSIELPQFVSACFTFDGVFWNCIYITKADFINAAAPQAPLTIIHAGEFNIGDIPAGDPIYDVMHNKNIIGDYTVVFCNKSPEAGNDQPVSRVFDNDVIGTWFHFTNAANKANGFRVCLQERAAGQQNLSVSYIIVKK
jgi:hypothetical protein